MPRAELASPAANRSPPSSDQRERPSEKWRATSVVQEQRAGAGLAKTARRFAARCVLGLRVSSSDGGAVHHQLDPAVLLPAGLGGIGPDRIGLAEPVGREGLRTHGLRAEKILD